MRTNAAPQGAPDAPLLLPIPAVARLLGLGRTTVYELVNAGRLPVVHVGRSARIPRTEVEAFVADLMASQGDLG